MRIGDETDYYWATPLQIGKSLEGRQCFHETTLRMEYYCLSAAAGIDSKSRGLL